MLALFIFHRHSHGKVLMSLMTAFSCFLTAWSQERSPASRLCLSYSSWEISAVWASSIGFPTLVKMLSTFCSPICLPESRIRFTLCISSPQSMSTVDDVCWFSSSLQDFWSRSIKAAAPTRTSVLLCCKILQGLQASVFNCFSSVWVVALSRRTGQYAVLKWSENSVSRDDLKGCQQELHSSYFMRISIQSSFLAIDFNT